MTRIKQAPRDASKLSGKPLAETLEESPILHTSEEHWTTSPDLAEDGLAFTPGEIDSMTLYLLANPNRMSSHLFRADVLFDSWGMLSTPEQHRERFLADVGGGPEPEPESSGTGSSESGSSAHIEPIAARQIAGFELSRTVVRRLIPRNPNLDRPLEQTCHFFHTRKKGLEDTEDAKNSLLVVYLPHVATKEDLPWYHPLLQSWALLYDYTAGKGRLSLHFLLYPDGEEISNRLERTLHALINTQLRLARGSSQSPSSKLPEGSAKPSKDNVIPQHLVQNTYLRLKLAHASDLHGKWVEDTDPSKHIFEDLAIAAFLVELWRSMYGVVPRSERETNNDQEEKFDSKFPGFVDVACGNGVLVYLLLMEGYQGWGFDARQRKTWKIFPDWIQNRLREEVYIPQPFADVHAPDLDMKTHTGSFPNDTFIISNHADELTVWTPLMAALASPHSPLPFLAIPCCSHSLSGARYRYPPPKKTDQDVEQNPQPANGDLQALRAAKIAAQTTEAGMNKSMYGSLTAKTMAVAEEVGYGVEKTMLRMPSTRNMGVLGGRRRVTAATLSRTGNRDTANAVSEDEDVVVEQIRDIVRRECAREGGVDAAAKVWMERVKGLHQGKGSSQRH